jgi:hypothetical protein
MTCRFLWNRQYLSLCLFLYPLLAFGRIHTLHTFERSFYMLRQWVDVLLGDLPTRGAPQLYDRIRVGAGFTWKRPESVPEKMGDKFLRQPERLSNFDVLRIQPGLRQRAFKYF